MDEMEEVGVVYKGNSYGELVYVTKEEVDSLQKIIMDEATEIFVMAGREFHKKELESLSFEGIAIQFY